jgi:predicted permease
MFAREFRYTVRSLSKAPGFAAIAILTIAIGIAVNTAVFTVLNALAFRPMPVSDPASIVRVFPVDKYGQRQNLFSYPDYLDYRASVTAFSSVTAYVPVELSVKVAAGESREGLGYLAGPEYFSTLGIQPSRGRIFEERDGPYAVVLGHEFWQRQLNGDPSALGSSVTVNGRTFTVVGIGPSEFQGTEPLVADMWLPLSSQPVVRPGDDALQNRNIAWLLMLGRLSPGATRETAERQASLVASRLAHAFAGASRPASIRLAAATFFPLDPALAPLLTAVLAVTALVLAIACANVGSFVLTRITNRGHELAVRRALGASRPQLIRLLLLETLVIGAAGGAAGLLLSMWALRFLYPLALTLLPYSWTTILDLSPDSRVYLYTAIAAFAASGAFGLAPAVIGTRPAPAAGLQAHSASGALRGPRARLRTVLIIAQVAVCFTLLVAGGLLARGLQNARGLDLGFDVSGVVTMDLNLQRQGYSQAAGERLVSTIVQRLESDAAAAKVALTTYVPLTGGVQRTQVSLGDGGEAMARHWATRAFVSPEYFGVLGIPVVRGRNFTTLADDGTAVIISEGLAQRFWPGEDAIGRSLSAPTWSGPRTIVGLVRDTSATTIWREKEMALYLPIDRGVDMRSVRILVRGAGSTEATSAAMRAAVRTEDPSITVRAASLEGLLVQWILPSRIAAVTAGIFAGLALCLAAIGLYGVVAASVAHRTREIGIRSALGADQRRLVTLILRDCARLILIGLAVGLIGAFAAARLLAAFIFGVSTVDPIAFAGSLTLLSLTGLAAGYVPARRAARIEPVDALRA